MAYLGHAISATDAINVRIHAEIARAATAPPLTDSEKAESQLAKVRAITALESTIATVDSTLALLQQPRQREAAASTTDQNADDYITLVNQPSRYALLNPMHRRMLPAASGIDAAKNVMALTSAGEMRKSTKTLKEMATAIEPIVTGFDNVLAKPYLESYSASLNTVPVVGIKGKNIMYVNKQSSKLPGLGIVENWAVFSSLPPDADVAPDANNVFMFPFQKDFCLAIGRQVWTKAHCGEDDRAKAVDHWPKLYKDGWTKAGDHVLPSADVRGVVPFVKLSADRRDLGFYLVVLKSDSTLAVLVGDSLVENAVFKPLVFDGAAAPKFVRVAYWNDEIVGYDDANNIWNIEVNFDANTFSVADQTPDAAITELTATEVGPVIVRDGFLHMRIVNVDGDDASGKDPHYTWTKWIAQDGVSHLGVASPGVILDMNLLTRTLRSRYIETQTALYPVVNKIKAYCSTHKVYLDNVKKDFEAYNDADPDEAQKLALKAGKAFKAHSQAWAKIVYRSVLGSKESVNIMTSQISDVHIQLRTQLQILKDKLAGLKSVLEAQQGEMNKLQACFWGSVAAAFGGLALMILGVYTFGLVTVAGGALFMAGVVAASVFGSKISKLAEEMAGTTSQISVVTTAIDEMQTIVTSYEDLNEKYGTLNEFWGRMQNEASNMGDMDEATLSVLGEAVFADTSSIEGAIEITSTMGGACTQYLDTLNKQGIKLPVTRPVATRMLMNVHTLSGEDKQELSQDPSDALFHHHVHNATQKLRTGDHKGYEEEMDRAHAVCLDADATAAYLKVKTGRWFDVPTLTSSATFWQGVQASDQSFSKLLSTPDEARNRLNGSLEGVKPFVASMLQQTVSLATTVLQWSRDNPTADGAADSARKALESASEASQSAAMANNKFADFHQQARTFQQDLESDINGKRNDINGADAAAEQAKNHIVVPPELYASFIIWWVGLAAVESYKAERRAEIQRNHDRRVSELQATIRYLQELQQSGISFHASALTWIQMCEQVSGNLGRIYNTLTALEGQVEEDNNPYYSELMEVEWKNIEQDATTVLEVLSVHSPLTVSSYLVRSRKPEFGLHGLALAAGERAASSSSQSLVRALSPGADLVRSLNLQADSAAEVYRALDVIIQLPYVGGLVAYWNAAQVHKVTLLDITNHVRNQYVRLVATEYSAVRKLHSLSVLQEIRAANLASGKIPVDVFVQITFESFNSIYQSADGTLAEFDKSATEFDDTMVLVTDNLAFIQEQVAKLDVDISKLKKKERDMVYSYIADVITFAVSSGIAFMTNKSLPDSESKDKKTVPPSVSNAILRADELALNAFAMADSLKKTMKDLDLEEVRQLIHTVQLVKRDYDTTADQLTAVRPLFHQLLDGLKAVMASTKESRDELQQILGNLKVLDQFTISEDDATYMRNEWTKVKDASQSWLDTINRQGISPLTFSVRAPTTHA